MYMPAGLSGPQEKQPGIGWSPVSTKNGGALGRRFGDDLAGARGAGEARDFGRGGQQFGIAVAQGDGVAITGPGRGDGKVALDRDAGLEAHGDAGDGRVVDAVAAGLVQGRTREHAGSHAAVHVGGRAAEARGHAQARAAVEGEAVRVIIATGETGVPFHGATLAAPPPRCHEHLPSQRLYD
jgi:hypothetical protein